jgi:hypothetical protein
MLILSTFRVAVIHSYDLVVNTNLNIASTPRVFSWVERYPFVLFVREPYRILIPLEYDGDAKSVAIKTVAVVPSEEDDIYDHAKHGQATLTDRGTIMLELKNLKLPRQDSSIRIIAEINANDGPVSAEVRCEMKYQRKAEFGNYFMDRLSSI